MMDLPSFGQFKEGLSAIKAVLDTVKVFLDRKDSSKNKAEFDGLYEDLIKARSSIIAVQDSYLAMLTEKQKLEKQVAELEAWGEQKKSYKLREVVPGTGVLAYAYAPEGQATEPVHWLCQNCCDQGKKSVLQRQNQNMPPSMKCSACGNELHFPPPPRQPQRLSR